jgi:hypothetical protein
MKRSAMWWLASRSGGEGEDGGLVEAVAESVDDERECAGAAASAIFSQDAFNGSNFRLEVNISSGMAVGHLLRARY